ncbi:MAG: hypothetical protein GY799_22105 [Desulfobulbaceae bacterium]|nr:hypothetical protein [Desulfobulbaceae bacterium]
MLSACHLSEPVVAGFNQTILDASHCGSEMRFSSVIEEAPVIEQIMRHIGSWDPSPPLRAPPDEEDWPEDGQIPLTYHLVPNVPIVRADKNIHNADVSFVLRAAYCCLLKLTVKNTERGIPDSALV